MSYASLISEFRKVEKELGHAIIELVYKMTDHYGVPRPGITIRKAKTVKYKHPRLYLIFSGGLTSILHEVKHHIDYHERKGGYKTYEEIFIAELYAPAFACTEYEKWIDEYSKSVLTLQLEYVKMKDVIRERRWK